MTTQNSAMGDEELEQRIYSEIPVMLAVEGISEELYKSIMDNRKDSVELIMRLIKSRDQIALADLAWCLGKLRGLGYPAEHLEKKYALKQAQNKEK